MYTQKDIVAQYKKLYEDARNILTNPEADAEERAKVPQMIEAAKALKEHASNLLEIEDAHELADIDQKRQRRTGGFKSLSVTNPIRFSSSRHRGCS